MYIIMAIVNKHQDIVKHSSSYMLGNSVRVHINPLLEQCVVDGRLASDLEFALQTKDPSLLGSVSTRNPQYGSTGARHTSASDAADMLASANDAVTDFEENVKNQSDDARNEPSCNEPSSNEPTNSNSSNSN